MIFLGSTFHWRGNSAITVSRSARPQAKEVEENPDALIAYDVLVDMQAIRTLYDPDGALAIEETIPAGALYVGLIEADTKISVWVGAAVAPVLENPDQEIVRQRLDYAVTKMPSSTRASDTIFA